MVEMIYTCQPNFGLSAMNGAWSIELDHLSIQRFIYHDMNMQANLGNNLLTIHMQAHRNCLGAEMLIYLYI